MNTLTHGMATAIGHSRHSNQDAVFGNDNLFIIVDGMGAETAQLVFQTMNNQFEAKSENANRILNTLTTAYQKAAEVVQQKGLDAAASVTTVYVNEGTAYIAHVGNTRAYSVTKHTLDLLTTDHIIEEKSLEFGMDFGGDAYAPVLYRALGQSDEPPDTLIHPLKAGTGILLVSDGVYRTGAQLIEFDGGEQVMLPLHDKAILQIIREATDAQGACDALIAAAQEHGGNDNLAALFISNGFVFAVAES